MSSLFLSTPTLILVLSKSLKTPISEVFHDDISTPLFRQWPQSFSSTDPKFIFHYTRKPISCEGGMIQFINRQQLISEFWIFWNGMYAGSLWVMQGQTKFYLDYKFELHDPQSWKVLIRKPSKNFVFVVSPLLFLFTLIALITMLTSATLFDIYEVVTQEIIPDPSQFGIMESRLPCFDVIHHKIHCLKVPSQLIQYIDYHKWELVPGGEVFVREMEFRQWYGVWMNGKHIGWLLCIESAIQHPEPAHIQPHALPVSQAPPPPPLVLQAPRFNETFRGFLCDIWSGFSTCFAY
ncbi:hypothetical protein BDQ17DRAFT_1332005 [Cyathus striatus]|nr:hypothetical protein BDQ17DRAFT_1332005 [Cyathus striatus]